MKNQHSILSKRGIALAENPARIDFELFMEAAANIYCPENNPLGAFPLNVAENSLTAEIIKDKLTNILHNKTMPDWVLKYTHLLGNPEVRQVVAQFMENHLCKCPINADSIGFSAGASAVVEVATFVLANKGDVVVIPAPAYPMYTKDFGTKSGLERYDLQTHHDLEDIGSQVPVNTDLLNKALADLEQQNKCFKILLISSPDNPTGCRYNKKQLNEIADWCIQHKIHLVINEIYGLSLIDTNHDLLLNDYDSTEEFESFAKIMAEKQSDFLHFWYAFSKDFSMSGLRFGLIHSLNQQLIKAYENANLPHLVANITQWLIAELLQDEKFVTSYIVQNKLRLNESYKLTIQFLKELNIPYIPSRGSLFVWVDLSKFLKENTAKAEEALWIDIYKKSGVLLTPGVGFGHTKKGLFRVVYTAVSYAYLKVALTRMKDYFSAKK